MSPKPVLFCAALLCLPAAARCDDDENGVRVTVVGILATDKNDTINPKLEGIAKEVRKLDPKLTGFEIAKMTCKVLTVGGKDDFDLGNDQTLHIVVERKGDEEGRYQLKITPPRMGDITYATTCGKYFPVMTPFRTKDGELLIVGVRIQPCPAK